jgi:hypothetical protein
MISELVLDTMNEGRGPLNYNKAKGKSTGTVIEKRDTPYSDYCPWDGPKGHAECLRPPPFLGSTFCFKDGGGKTTFEPVRIKIFIQGYGAS